VFTLAFTSTALSHGHVMETTAKNAKKRPLLGNGCIYHTYNNGKTKELFALLTRAQWL
jgi:hypothetical protein